MPNNKLPVPSFVKQVADTKSKMLKRASDSLEKTTDLAVKPLKFTQVDVGKYAAEYVTRPNKLIIHFFCKNKSGIYPASFRGRLFNALQLLGAGDQRRLDIDFAPELGSWSVVIDTTCLPEHAPEVIEAAIRDVIS